MTSSAAKVFLVDDEASVRKALQRLIRELGYEVETFASARELLDRPAHDGPCCLVLDVRMPELSGLDLQEALAATGSDIPIIFMTGHGNIAMGVRAMKAGAMDFLTKPVRDTDLQAAIEQAIAAHVETRRRKAELEELRERLARLTPREREVLPLVTQGLMNKQIAARLGSQEATVKIHRARIMQKMEVQTLADLVKAAYRLGLSGAEV